MISQNYYDAKMLEAFKLMGNDSKGNREMARAIYGRIEHNYTDEDLSAALESAMQSENPKINYPVLLRHLNTKRAVRFEMKAKTDREEGEEGARKFWDQEGQGNCLTHNCSHCQRRAGRCDTIAKHTLEAIKLMMNRQWRAKTRDESWGSYYDEVRAGQRTFNKTVMMELNRQFPEIGFNKDYGTEKKTILTRAELRAIMGGQATNTKPTQLRLVDVDFPPEDNDHTPTQEAFL